MPSSLTIALPTDVQILSGSPEDSLGNLVVKVEGADGARVLKVYRTRRGPWRDSLSSFSARMFERRTGADPAARLATERRCLEVWTREGFNAPSLLDLPAPEWVSGGSLWIEHCPGPRLEHVLRVDDVAIERKRDLIVAFARDTHARHRRALELDEVLLLQEHPTLKHVLVQEDDRLVTIDFEASYLPGYSVRYAIAQELAGLLRSIPPIETRGGLADLFLDAYADDELLGEACREFFRLYPFRLLRRLSDGVRRARSKTSTLRHVRARLRGQEGAMAAQDLKW